MFAYDHKKGKVEILKEPIAVRISRLRRNILYEYDFISGIRDKVVFHPFTKVPEQQWHLDLYFYWQSELRKVLGVANKNFKQPDFKGFINIKVTEEQFDLYQQWDVHDVDLYLLLSANVAAGYKQTSSYDADKETYNATFICSDKDSPNYGYGLSAFAPDWYNAIRLLVFKHEVLLQGNWGSPPEKSNSPKWG